jgi:N-methylhydantoinase B
VKAQRVLTPGFITHESERHTEAPWGIFGGTSGAVGHAAGENARSLSIAGTRKSQRAVAT